MVQKKQITGKIYHRKYTGANSYDGTGFAAAELAVDAICFLLILMVIYARQRVKNIWYISCGACGWRVVNSNISISKNVHLLMR